MHSVEEPTVVAVDWSGARGPAQRNGIWVAIVRDGEVAESTGRHSREEATAIVAAQPGPVLAGFDFSFGLPEWFARANGCENVTEVWALAGREADTWLTPTAPFWRVRCEVPARKRFRQGEERLRRDGLPAKSVFQLVGNGQVGAGSVRGMPLLAQLRDAGFAIWPFDAAGPRTVVEIYPSALRASAPHLGRGEFPTLHARDAVVSALVMWEHRRELAALPARKDEITRLEGDVWRPRSRAGNRL